jgi:RNA polymerase sigma-32 factor
LSREDERTLAVRYRETGDLAAAHKLMEANLRFVVKVAHEYKGYRLDLQDLIQEGNIGLMMAVKKFDPDKGYRLISYAVWWIRAYIQSYVMRSWSLVKVGTTQAQRRLFYKVRSERQIADRQAGPGQAASLNTMAKRLRAAAGEVSNMELRLAGRDLSLDAPVGDAAYQTRQDLLSSPGESQENRLADMEECQLVRSSVSSAMGGLNEKERYIANHRLMAEEPKTLQEIGHHFRISRERARQIEGNVLRKIRATLVKNHHFARAAA